MGSIAYQNTQIVGCSESLFFTSVRVGGKVTLGGMLDSGSMACTISETSMCTLLDDGAIWETDRFSSDVTLVGVGGQGVTLKSAFNIDRNAWLQSDCAYASSRRTT